MLLSVNYSHAAADLFQAGIIEVDRFKCPAWPDAIEAALEVNDVYIHFPLVVGSGIGDAINTESGEPADWGAVETFMVQTNTPVVNLHLGPTIDDYPGISIDSTHPDHVQIIIERLIADVNSVIGRFGAERVVVENIHNGNGKYMHSVFLPEVISQVIEETSCGFLFDISHALLAAEFLGADIYDYINGLPTHKIREIHITGIHKFEGRWIKIAEEAGFDQQIIEQYRGHYVDHLPMTDSDWAFFTWSLGQIENGIWSEPWVITLEYGGIGGMFAPITDREVLQRQVPRMYDLVRGKGEGRKAWKHK